MTNFGSLLVVGSMKVYGPLEGNSKGKSEIKREYHEYVMNGFRHLGETSRGKVEFGGFLVVCIMNVYGPLEGIQS
eukprot:1360962-Amorphochlora_amoeboformis.AAC.1